MEVLHGLARADGKARKMFSSTMLAIFEIGSADLRTNVQSLVTTTPANYFQVLNERDDYAREIGRASCRERV